MWVERMSPLPPTNESDTHCIADSDVNRSCNDEWRRSVAEKKSACNTRVTQHMSRHAVACQTEKYRTLSNETWRRKAQFGSSSFPNSREKKSIESKTTNEVATQRSHKNAYFDSHLTAIGKKPIQFAPNTYENVTSSPSISRTRRQWSATTHQKKKLIRSKHRVRSPTKNEWEKYCQWTKPKIQSKPILFVFLFFSIKNAPKMFPLFAQKSARANWFAFTKIALFDFLKIIS